MATDILMGIKIKITAILLILSFASYSQTLDKIVDDKIKKALDTIKVNTSFPSADTVWYVQKITNGITPVSVDTMQVSEISIFNYDITTVNKTTGDKGNGTIRVVVENQNGVYSLTYKSISVYSGKGTAATCKAIPSVVNNTAVLTITGTLNNNIKWDITRTKSINN